MLGYMSKVKFLSILHWDWVMGFCFVLCKEHFGGLWQDIWLKRKAVWAQHTESLEGDQEEMVMRGREGEHTLMVCGVDWWRTSKDTQGISEEHNVHLKYMYITLYIPTKHMKSDCIVQNGVIRNNYHNCTSPELALWNFIFFKASRVNQSVLIKTQMQLYLFQQNRATWPSKTENSESIRSISQYFQEVVGDYGKRQSGLFTDSLSLHV